MPYLPTGYSQATVNFTGANVPTGAAIVICVKNELLLTAGGVAQNVFNAFASAVPLMCSSDVTLTSVDVKNGPNEDGPISTYAGTPTAGAVGGTSLSPGSALLVEKQTTIGGRRGRGRMYWPGVYDGWADDGGNLVSGVQAQIDGFMQDLLDDLAGDDVPMYLAHSPSYIWVIKQGQPRRIPSGTGVPPDPSEVLHLAADPRIATQRRRLR